MSEQIGRENGRGPSRRDVLRISAAVGVTAAFGGGVSLALLRQAGWHSIRQTRSRMGTIVSITVTHPDAEGGRAMVEAGFSEMERLEADLTRHRSGAPLERLNRVGRLPDPPEPLRHVVRHGLRMAELSGGAFDPTVLPVLDAWADARARGLQGPDDRSIEAARALTGYSRVRFDGDVLALDRPGMGITLDGIAKGYVVDRTSARLVADGADRVLVDAGGDMATAGDGSVREPWTVAVENPQGTGAPEGLVRLGGGCIATSGDYMQAFTRDRRHHHIIDPRTGRSPRVVSAVTVLAGSAMEADALSTALMVLGPEEGRGLVERLPGAEALIVDKHGARTPTSGFAIVRT